MGWKLLEWMERVLYRHNAFNAIKFIKHGKISLGGTYDDFKHLLKTTHCRSLLHITLEHPGKLEKT